MRGSIGAPEEGGESERVIPQSFLVSVLELLGKIPAEVVSIRRISSGFLQAAAPMSAPEIRHALNHWCGKRMAGIVVKHAVVFALAGLLAGCAGHVEMLEGLSGEEHRAYTRADSSCDGRARSRDPVCYNPESEKPQH